MAVGTVRAFVIDVNDLDVGERFWSTITGQECLFSGWGGQFSRIGPMGNNSILLQLVPEEKTPLKNRAHLDITVHDIDQAVEQIIGLVGSVVRPKGTYGPDGPRLEWAIMADPFRNEFCIIRDIL